MRSARPTLVLLASAVILTAGCGTFFKDDYWTEFHRQSDQDELARLRDDPTSAFFLGIRSPAAEVPYQVGVLVEHVYAEGPAARAGLRPGDEIRRVGARSVRTPGDARYALSTLWKDEDASERVRRETLARLEVTRTDDYVAHVKVPLVFARSGREIEVTVELTTREGYLDHRRQRLLDLSRVNDSGWNSLFLSRRRHFPGDLVTGYFGVEHHRDLLVSSDWDLLPLFLGISLLRVEKIPVAEALRVTVLCSLFQLSFRGEDLTRSLEGLVAPVPEGLTDL